MTPGDVTLVLDNKNGSDSWSRQWNPRPLPRLSSLRPSPVNSCDHLMLPRIQRKVIKFTSSRFGLKLGGFLNCLFKTEFKMGSFK